MNSWVGIMCRVFSRLGVFAAALLFVAGANLIFVLPAGAGAIGTSSISGSIGFTASFDPDDITNICDSLADEGDREDCNQNTAPAVQVVSPLGFFSDSLTGDANNDFNDFSTVETELISLDLSAVSETFGPGDGSAEQENSRTWEVELRNNNQFRDMTVDIGLDLQLLVTSDIFEFNSNDEAQAVAEILIEGDDGFFFNVNIECDGEGCDNPSPLSEPLNEFVVGPDNEFRFRVETFLSTRAVTESFDVDGDGVPDEDDNAPFDFNPGQEDLDGDDIGDVADDDIDGDGIPNGDDPDPFNPEIVGLPVADADGPYFLDLGLGNEITLDGSGSFSPNGGGNLTYSWDVGGLLVDTPFPLLDFDVSSLGDGLFPVTLILLDNFGLTDSDVSELTIVAAVEQDDGGPQVPEPGTLALFGIGLVGLGAVARRRRKAA